MITDEGGHLPHEGEIMQKSNKVIISCGMALYFCVGGLQWQKNLMKACKFLQGI